MTRRIRAFLLGVWEFRSSCTTNLSDDLMNTYDRGRDLVHIITLRRYEV